MCTLALTVYIDHEPFNELNLPRMCRIYDSSELKSLEGSAFNFKGMFVKGKGQSNPLSPKVRDVEVSEKTEMHSGLLKLIENIAEYLKNEVNIYYGSVKKFIRLMK